MSRSRPTALDEAPLSRPDWLPRYIPALDGLRGIAIGLVILYHSHTLLGHGLVARFAEFGWAGVNLFFVLSGFLITGIILDSRDDLHFFRNFYARRALRIWPMYVLLLLLNYLALPTIMDRDPGRAWMLTASAPWGYYALFVQNLFFLFLPAPVAPTWSLAIEEQFYVVWAPIGRRLRPAYLAVGLIAVFAASPIVRVLNSGTGFLTKTNTLVHLDGLAIGSLIAVLLRMELVKRRHWPKIGIAAIALGIIGVVLMVWYDSSLTDTFLALGFAGLLVTAIFAAERSNLYGRALRAAPLKFLGTVSYGLYMTHILMFVVIGYGEHWVVGWGQMGNFAIASARIVLSVAFAALLWHWFEKPILRLKSRFEASPHALPTRQRPPEEILPEPVAAD